MSFGDAGESSVLEILVTVASALQAAAGLAIAATAPAFVQRSLLAGQRQAPLAFIYLLITAVAGGVLIILSMPSDAQRFLTDHLGLMTESFIPSAVRITALLLLLQAGMLVSAGWWDRRHTMGAARGLRDMPALFPHASAVLAIGLLVFLLWPTTAGVAMKTPNHRGFPILVLMIIAGANAGGFARAMADRGLERIASLTIAVPPTIAAIVLTYWLLSVSIYAHGAGWDVGQSLLGVTPADGPATLSRTLGRWAAIYSISVLTLGAGGWLGIRLAPRPVIRPSRPVKAAALAAAAFDDASSNDAIGNGPSENAASPRLTR